MAFDLKHLLADSLPDYAFELSEAGIAWSRPSAPAPPQFLPLAPEVLTISPLRDNVQRPEVLNAAIAKIAGDSSGRKRRSAVVILPDFCARVAVLDFDSFPADADEQLSLVRFRMKKSVPFDLESALVRYHAQPAAGGGGRVNVIVVVAALEIIARYEASFRGAGLHAGVITTSTLAAIELDTKPGIAVLAKLSGKILSVSVLQDGVLRLLRTVELGDVNADEIAGVLFPTVAFIEDELGTRPSRLLSCGFDGNIRPALEAELGIPTHGVESRWGAPKQTDAGLLGYLESLR